MDFKQQLSYCESIFSPYKEQQSEITLYNIYRYILDYCLDDFIADYTDEEYEELDLIQEFELRDYILSYLDEDGFVVYDNYGTDDV